MRISELVFEETEETNAAINRIAEIVSKAVILNNNARDLTDYCKSVNLKQQLRLIIVQSLKFGHAITQITRTRFIVENSIDYIFDENLKQLLKRKNIDYELSLSDLLSPENHDVQSYKPEQFHFFILNPRYTTDPYGLLATKPILRSADMESGVITAESKAAKRYVKPSMIITAPDGATQEERTSVKKEIDSMDDIEDLVMPAGFAVLLLGMGESQYKSGDLLDRTRQKIITGLGVPPLALSIPEGTNKASAQYSLDLLHDKCIPMAEILLLQLNRIFADLFMIQDALKLKKLSVFDIEMESKSRMMDFEGLSMLANAATAEGLDPAAKQVLVKLITDYKTPEA